VNDHPATDHHCDPAVPILIQGYLNAGLAYWLSRRFGVACGV